MKKYTLLLLLVVLSTIGKQAVAQCLDNSYDYLDINKVSARYNNSGTWFWDMFGESEYIVPKGSGNYVTFAGALWIGGLDPQGDLHMTGATYRQTGWEWYGGPYRTTQAFQCPATIETGSGIFQKGIKRLSNGKLLILCANEVLIHDLQTHQTLTRPLPAPRTWMNAVELQDGRIFLFGDDTYPTKNPVLFMDMVNYTISGGPTLNWYHKESSINLMLDGTVLLAGVIGCEVFDPVTNLSTAVPDMVWPRMKHDAVTLPNGDVMTFGGGGSLNGTGLTIVTQYYRDDGSTNFWYQGPYMSVGRQRAIAAQMPNGKIFISGGNVNSNLTDLYDPLLNTMTPAAPLPFSTTVHSVTALDSQTVLIAADNQGLIQSRLYKFNIYNGQYEAIFIQRAGPRSFLIDSSTVLVETNSNQHLQRVDFKTHVQDDDRWQFVWKVTRAQIDQFRADFLANSVDFSRYPVIESWPAHGDELLGEDRNLAPFVDVNSDGHYRPADDGDYPCIVGDQALWWVFNDQGPHLETLSSSMGLQVEAMAYAFDCSQSTCPDTSMDYTTFLHLEITNHGDTAYHDVHIGNYQDVDIGDWLDDYVACDSMMGLAIAYNGTDNDARYGIHPPAWGNVVLPNGKIDSMGGFHFIERSTFSNNGPPLTKEHFYNYLTNRFQDGMHVVNNGLDGYPGTAAGPVTNFMFPSTDGFCGGPMTGWSEVTAGNSPLDRQFLQSFGPLDLQAGESTQLDLGFVYARGSDNLQSVCVLKTATATIQNWWQNQLDRSCFNLVVERDEPAAQHGFKVYPNPSGLGYVQLEWEASLDEEGMVEVIDLQGRVLISESLPVGEKQHRLALSNLSGGMYLVRLVQGDDVQVQRLVID